MIGKVEILFLIILVLLFGGLSLFTQRKTSKKAIFWYIIALSLILILSLVGIFFESAEKGFYFILFWFGGCGVLILLGIIMGFSGFKKSDLFHPDENIGKILRVSMSGGFIGGAIFSAILYFGLHFPLYISIVELTLPFFFSYVFLPTICEKSSRDNRSIIKVFLIGFTISLSTFFMIIGAKGLSG